MNVQVQLMLDVPDDQKLEQLHHKAAAAFDDVDEVQVISHSAGRMDTEYRVVGTIRGKPDERFDEVVLAQSTEEAEAKAIELEPKLAPAAVVSADEPPIRAG